MIYPTDGALPRDMRGWSCWLQTLYRGRWLTVCNLSASEARQAALFLHERPDCRWVRVLYERSS